jgi:hypothetical protein
MEIKVLRNASPEEIAGILHVESVCMGDWQYDGADIYYRQMLADVRNINTIAKEGAFVYGYLLAVPHNTIVGELWDADPDITEEPQRFYFETMDILPGYGKRREFIKMVYKLIDEAENIFGVNKFSMHARVENGLSDVVQRFFRGMITSVRRIERWKYYNEQESADYIEATFIKALSRVKI